MTRAFAPASGTALLAMLCATSLFFALRTGSESVVAPLTRSGPRANTAKDAVTISLPQRRPDPYYNAISERPLFAPTRRPIAPDAPVTAATVPDVAPVKDVIVAEPVETPPEPPPPFRLLGVMTTGKSGRALIAVGDTDPTWLVDGETIQGWRIGPVTPEAVTIHKDKTVIELEIYAQ